MSCAARRGRGPDYAARADGRPGAKRWNQYVSGLGADRAKAESLLGETRILLERITSADRNDAMVLQQQKLNVGRQMKETTAAKTANRRYSAAGFAPRRSALDLQR